MKLKNSLSCSEISLHQSRWYVASDNAQIIPVDEVILSLFLFSEKRRPELIPEDLHRHYIHTMQERVHPEIQRHLEDFR